MVFRRVVPQALLNENRVVLEGGDRNQRLPSGRVYVSPSSGRVYDGEKGDRLTSLPPDATEIDKTTWYLELKFWGKKSGGKPPLQLRTLQRKPIQIAVQREPEPAAWYQTSEGIRRLQAHFLEMNQYFHDFELCENESGALVWVGDFGFGEVQLVYPDNYPEQLFRFVASNATESENSEINQKIAEYQRQDITPAGSLIVAMRLILASRGKADAVVHNPARTEETDAGKQTDA